MGSEVSRGRKIKMNALKFTRRCKPRRYRMRGLKWPSRHKILGLSQKRLKLTTWEQKWSQKQVDLVMFTRIPGLLANTIFMQDEGLVWIARAKILSLTDWSFNVYFVYLYYLSLWLFYFDGCSKRLNFISKSCFYDICIFLMIYSWFLIS